MTREKPSRKDRKAAKKAQRAAERAAAERAAAEQVERAAAEESGLPAATEVDAITTGRGLPQPPAPEPAPAPVVAAAPSPAPPPPPPPVLVRVRMSAGPPEAPGPAPAQPATPSPSAGEPALPTLPTEPAAPTAPPASAPAPSASEDPAAAPVAALGPAHVPAHVPVLDPATEGDHHDPQTIGVVFVPGVGNRPPGETLLAWSRPLLRLLGAWQATTRGVRPSNDATTRVGIDPAGTTRPFVTAAVPAIGDHPAQQWMLTEVRLPAPIEPPPTGALLRWLALHEPWRTWKGIVSGIAGEGRALFRLLDLVLLPLLLLPATAVVAVVFVLLRLLRVVPLRWLGARADAAALGLGPVRRFAVARLLLSDRLQAASLRANVAAAIADCCDAGCGTVVVIAHGSGAIVGYMTLADETYTSLPVNAFITHGQALGVAWRLGRADEYDTPDRDPGRLYRGDRLRTSLARLPFRDGLRWHDFWATHDPVPAGTLESGRWVTLPDLVRGTSSRVSNRMSLRRDHDAYWDNDEQFVLPVARLIEGSPHGAPTATRFFPEGDRVRRVEHRRRRVKILHLARAIVMASLVAAVPLAILHPLLPGDGGSLEAAGQVLWDAVAALADRIGLGIEVGGIAAWFAAVLGGFAALVLLWLAGATLGRLWTRWDARERAIALQPIPGWRWTWALAFRLALCAAAAVVLLGFVASGDWSWTAPSIALVVTAWLLGLLAGRGRIRRPTEEELDLAGVRPGQRARRP